VPTVYQAAGPYELYDLTESNLLHEASELLGVKHLSAAAGPVSWPVSGLLYGPLHRPLVCLPTTLGNSGITKNVIYFVVTASPLTQLSKQVFQALGAADPPPSAASVSINGQQLQVRLCSPAAALPDIPVLGADSMAAMGLKLNINYRNHSVLLLKAD